MKRGDRIKLPDGRRGTVVDITEPIRAWNGDNGRLMMERRREFEVEVANRDGSKSRVFVTEQDGSGLLLPAVVALACVAIAALAWWALFK